MAKYRAFRGIRTRLIALVLLPLAVIAIVFGAHMIHHGRDERARLDALGPLIANHLALAAEAPLRAGNLSHLKAICDALVRQPEVTRAEIRDASFKLLVAANPPDEPTGDRGRRFSAPISSSLGPSSDPKSPLSRPPGAILGWAQVQLASASGTGRPQTHLAATLGSILASAALSVLAALYLGNGLTRDLRRLSATLARYRRGDLAARAAPQSIDELDALARGFNRMANELAGSQQAMRRQVQIATRELRWSLEALRQQNAQLERAREEAFAASRDREAFLARMSHEMRSPLNAVIGFGRLLHEEAGTEASAEYSRTLDRAARQLLSVIDDILNYVKLQSKELPLESVPFEPRACLEDVVAMLAPEAYAKGLELALAIHSSVPEQVIGAPSRLSQVLINLVNNAIKFTDAGHVFIEVDYCSRDEAAGTLRISVSDTGIGLSAEQQQRLFQPFEQADATITRRYGGTGLGLSISKRLLELMDGRISVRSALGHGARFRITLPCPVCSPTSSPTKRAPRRLRRLLLCDPAPIQVRALRPELLHWAAEVYSASDQHRLPAMLREAEETGNRFELLILGLEPHEPNSSELEQRLAMIRRTYTGPILLLIGDYQWKPPPRIRAMQPLAWAEKPLRRARLLSALNQLAGGAKPPGPPQKSSRKQFPHRRAVVVDDNDFNRALIRKLLEIRGIQVTEAKSGQDAIRLTVTATPDRIIPDLIIMDIHMPSMDGIEAARRIRTALAAGRPPPIIALTADAFMGDRLSNPSPFDCALLKPVSEAQLDSALDYLLNGIASPSREHLCLPVEAAATAIEAPAVCPSASPFISPPASPFTSLARLDPAWPKRLQAALELQMGEIDAALAAEDHLLLQERLHDLKGLCGLFGLRTLSDRIAKLEAAAKTEPTQVLRDQVSALKPLLFAMDGAEAHLRP